MTRRYSLISFSLLLALGLTLLAQDASFKGQLAASGSERETTRSLPVAASESPRPSAGTVSKPIDLLAGAKWTYSIDGGKTFSAGPLTIKADTTVNILARAEFEAADTSGLVVLELTHGLSPYRKIKFFLNGNEVKGPMEGMYYKTIPAVDAKLLIKGRNILTAETTIKNVSRGKHKAKDIQFKVAMRLAALKAEHLKIQIGPILGAFGKDYFTVTCRTNMPASVFIYRAGVPKTRINVLASTEPALIHRLKVPVGQIDEQAEYVVVAGTGYGGYTVTATVKRSPRAQKNQLRFVALGDSRVNIGYSGSSPDVWAKVADVVLKVEPDLVVHSGDMVSYGGNDWEWNEHLFAPAKKLFATIPFYAVIGNHEGNAPLYNELFYTPSKDGRDRNWAQIINGVLLIGIDGEQDFSAGSENGKWLEKTLAGSKAKFIFFFNHYPAWTSSGHGQLDKKTGRPREKAVRQAQDVIAPLLTKYKATAYVCGHCHIYERSELPDGLAHINSSGAGVLPLRKKSKNAEKQNPYSKVFHSVLNYCIFEIKGDSCTMKAFTPDGKVIDTRKWKARK